MSNRSLLTLFLQTYPKGILTHKISNTQQLLWCRIFLKRMHSRAAGRDTTRHLRSPMFRYHFHKRLPPQAVLLYMTVATPGFTINLSKSFSNITLPSSPKLTSRLSQQVRVRVDLCSDPNSCPTHHPSSLWSLQYLVKIKNYISLHYINNVKLL